MEEKIKKLTKEMQQYIEKITRQRDEAQEQLKEYLDDQTESGIWQDDFTCIHRRRYIQGRSITINSGKINVDINIVDSDIRIYFRRSNRTSKHGQDVAVVPQATNSFYLVPVTKE